jgi:hypothetical protein
VTGLLPDGDAARIGDPARDLLAQPHGHRGSSPL